MADIDSVATLDLNLLGTLEVLLEERSTTKAAQRLGLTQSTLSHALARLRVQFGDPLLVRGGRALVPTPRAEELLPALRRVLADARRLVQATEQFEPARSTRVFGLVCPDLLVAFLPELLGRVEREAPGVRLEVRPPLGVDVEGALALGSADLALGPEDTIGPGLRQRVLGSVGWCVLARRGHPGVVRGKLTREAWLAHPHVLVGTGDRDEGIVGAALRAAGLRRRIGFVAPGFLAAPFALKHSDAFYTAPRELVSAIAASLDLVVLPAPLTLPRVKVVMLWHERQHADPAHRWLREQLVSATGAVFGRGR